MLAPVWLVLRKASALDYFETAMEAYKTAEEVIKGLSLDDFASTKQLAVDLADEYGIKIEGKGWYFKVTVDDDVPDAIAVVISLHPLEQPLKTNGGWLKP